MYVRAARALLRAFKDMTQKRPTFLQRFLGEFCVKYFTTMQILNGRLPIINRFALVKFYGKLYKYGRSSKVAVLKVTLSTEY
jgi:hypothetical protein